MIRAIIIDDEQHCINRLENLLQQYAPQVQLLGSLLTLETGINAIRTLLPDLVLLDVQLDQYTAFDLLEQTRHIPFDVIFTTAHDQYAVQAFKCSAIDYLLKPVDADSLAAAIAKLSLKLSREQLAGKIDNLLHNLQTDTPARRICVPVAEGLHFLHVADLVRCESSSNYTILYTKDKQKLVMTKTLKEVESMLEGHAFFRIHHSHLVNLDFIKTYHKGNGGTVTMLDNSELAVSTRRKEAFLKRLTLGR